MRKRGFDVERELVRRFKEAGGFALRSPASLGVDVIAFLKGEIRLIQCKYSKSGKAAVPAREVDALLEAKERIERALKSVVVRPFVYVRFSRGRGKRPLELWREVKEKDKGKNLVLRPKETPEPS